MNSRLTSLFAALALAAALQAPVALSAPIVTATQVTANPGDTVTVSMTVKDDGSDNGGFGVINMNEIGAWDFRLRWDHTVLGDLLGTSTMDIVNVGSMDMAALATYLGGVGTVLHNDKEGFGTEDGTYYLSWSTDFLSAYPDFDDGTDNGFTFNAMFDVSGIAAAGDYYLDFLSKDGSLMSSLADSGFILTDDYGDVTQGARMTVTVNAPPTPAPEPGMLALLLGGIGALGLARRRKAVN
jgi:hypothetical protein